MLFKKTIKAILIFGTAFFATACINKNDTSKTQTTNGVEKVLEQQIDKADKTNATENGIAENKTMENKNVKSDSVSELDKNVDIDLTGMGSNMVYATIFQFMVEPDEYIGKTIKIDGLYYAAFHEATKKYYHYVIIQDALACCATGIEFVWGDGSHVYPDEYPKDNSEVVVTGCFESYYENEILYCRLVDAVLEEKL